MYCNDLFGQNSARGFQAAHAAAKPSWELVDVIPWPEPPQDLSTEVSRAKAAKPDIIAPITRPASAQVLLPEIRKQRIDMMGVVSPGGPGLYEAGQLATLKEDLEYVMASVPWPNFKNPRTKALAEEYLKRSSGKTFDTNSGYSYDAMFLIADVLERARSADADAIVEALKKTNYTAGLMQYGGPIVFNELGDNANAIPTMIQILGQKPVAVWPKDAALQKPVFPRPKA
jgi:branched-chain amino acid transport system substrate-binding protein